MGKERIKAAIIGAGGIAQAHVRGFQEHGDQCELVGVADTDRGAAERLGAQYGISGVYAGVDALLESTRPDLVAICTPPAVHTELSIRCMDAGAWVLCEKPLCASLEELDRIVEGEERTGCRTASVFQWRFGSAAQHLKHMFEVGSLGSLYTGVCNTTWFRDQAYYDVPWRGTWKSELGGVTMGHGIHLTDLFLWLAGDWLEVKAMAGTLARNIEVEDVSSALVKFRNGALGTVLTTVLAPRQESYLRLDFEEATVETRGLYSVSNENWSFDRGERRPADPPDALTEQWSALSTDVPGGHAAQIGHMLADMREGRRPSTSGDGVRRTLEFISALYKSAFTGETVRTGSIGPGDPYYAKIHGGQG